MTVIRLIATMRLLRLTCAYWEPRCVVKLDGNGARKQDCEREGFFATEESNHFILPEDLSGLEDLTELDLSSCCLSGMR